MWYEIWFKVQSTKYDIKWYKVSDKICDKKVKDCQNSFLREVIPLNSLKKPHRRGSITPYHRRGRMKVIYIITMIATSGSAVLDFITANEQKQWENTDQITL